MIGNVATTPKVHTLEDGKERVSLRVVATERRLDAQGEWVDGDEFGVTVICWRALARNVAHSVHLGAPVIVVGKMLHRQYESEGQVKSIVELKASAIGLDLSRGTAKFHRTTESADRGNGAAGESTPGADEADAVDGSEDPAQVRSADLEPVPF